MRNAPVLDASGGSIAIGDRVEILALPNGLTEGIPEEAAAFIETIVGMTGEVDEIGDKVSVMLKNGPGRYHFVFFKGTMLQVVTPPSRTPTT